MPEEYRNLVNLVLRDHEGYTGDGNGGVGELPVGDRSTARKAIDKRDLRAVALAGNANVDAALNAAAIAQDAAIDVHGATLFASDLPSLLADTKTSYPVGTIFATRAEGLAYEVVSGDPDLTTAGGVMLRVVRRDECIFHDYEFIHPTQIKHIRNNDSASQNASVVTAGLQAMHNAGMAFVLAAPAGVNRIAVFQYRGKYAINDELFDETFAQNVWTMPAKQNSFVFRGDKAVFQCKNWPSHKAVRTSGMWAGVTEAVPMAVFRWEQSGFNEASPQIHDIRIVGEKKHTDPIGFKAARLNRFMSANFAVSQLWNVGRFIEGIVNSDEYNPITDGCGWQPTNQGGAGTIPAAARFSCTAGGGSSTLTATMPVFSASDVGKTIYVNAAATGGNVFSSTISSFVSSTQVTLTRECDVNVTGQTASFSIMVAETVASSNAMTTTNGSSLDLTGRYVMLVGAGSEVSPEFDVLATRVVSKTAPTSYTLASNARNSGTFPAVISPAQFIGFSDDLTGGGTNNDYQVWGERNENPKYDGANGAVCSVYQRARAHMSAGGKTHGMPPIYNNFGGNAFNSVFDSCWNIQMPHHQFEWGYWSNGYGAIVVIGDRSGVMLTDINIGNAQQLDATALLYINPKAPGTARCKVGISGSINTPANWPLTMQRLSRFGVNGAEANLLSLGPLIYKDAASGEQPATRVGRIVTKDGAPYDAARFEGPTSYSWTMRMAGGGDLLFGRDTGGASSFPVTFASAAPSNSLVLAAAGVTIRNPTLTNIWTHTDNAAAVAAGRTVGQVYQTPTGELRIVV